VRKQRIGGSWPVQWQQRRSPPRCAGIDSAGHAVSQDGLLSLWNSPRGNYLLGKLFSSVRTKGRSARPPSLPLRPTGLLTRLGHVLPLVRSAVTSTLDGRSASPQLCLKRNSALEPVLMTWSYIRGLCSGHLARGRARRKRFVNALTPADAGCSHSADGNGRYYTPITSDSLHKQFLNNPE